ncbi:hypothetical protein HDU67_008937 [Dinochytrium kinnereticum]|nr:hypothetical protein HDU67_008937 [Dinochytrium kinnereticum]
MEHMLRPTEHVVASAELSAKSDSGKPQNVTLAVIDSTDVRHGRLGPKITDKLPILSDFQLNLSQGKQEQGSKPTSDFTLVLSSQGKDVKLSVGTLERLQQILAHLKKCMFDAQSNDYKTAFSWLEYYTEEPAILSPVESAKESPKIIKEAFTARQLRNRESTFSEYKDLRLFVGTWNVNGNDVTEDLSPWLACEEKPDMYILGFQELDLSTEAYILSDRTKEDEWCAAIEKAIGSSYVKVASKQLVGMLIVSYLADHHSGRISEISCESVGTGILGLMGNKGAVGCRVRLYDTYLTFINSHLAADTNFVDRRNQDFNEICRRLQFPFNPANVSSPLQASLAPPATYGDYKTYLHRNPWVMNSIDLSGNGDAFGSLSMNVGNKSLTGIFDSDHIFWFGDLNYRVPLSDVDAKAMLDEGKLKDLLLYDQLLQEKRLKRAFTDFDESGIDFAPSYKFDVGTSRYDTSEKRRAPSWCDRILWHRNVLRSNDNDWINCKWYKTCMDLKLSDHKPVSTLFNVKVRKVDIKKFETCIEEINRELDRLENDALPVLNIDANVLEFGSVKYMHPVTKSITLENTGKVVANFRLVPKPGEDIARRPWCYVTPDRASLLPGEATRVNITIFVNNGPVASSLNFNLDVLEDLIILRTENGRDHFLAVSGTWLPSCYGNDVATLCRLIQPVRSYTVKELSDMYRRREEEILPVPEKEGEQLITLADSPTEQTEFKRLSIPKEIWRLIDFVFRFGMDVNGLFERRGDPKLVSYFRECLDTGSEFDIEGLLLDSVASGQVKRNDSAPFSAQPDSAVSVNATGGSVLAADLAALNMDASQTTPPAIDTSNAAFLPPSTTTTGKVLPLTKTGLGRSTSIHSAAEALLELLASLRDPVVPFSLYYRCVQEGYLSFAAAKQPSIVSISPVSSMASSVESTARVADKRASVAPLPSNMRIGTRLDSIAGGGVTATSQGGGGAFSNEARQRMFLMHFLVEGNEL